MQILHLSLKEHTETESRKIIRARGQRTLLCDSIFYIWQESCTQQCQQYRYLNEICTMTTPFEVPTWMGKSHKASTLDEELQAINDPGVKYCLFDGLQKVPQWTRLLKFLLLHFYYLKQFWTLNIFWSYSLSPPTLNTSQSFILNRENLGTKFTMEQ